jgi:hypothetical protein
MNCPFCHSDKIFNAGDGFLGCLCGERFRPGVAPYKKRSCEHVYTGKEYQQINVGKRGTCENCERTDMWLTNKLCGACISQKKFKEEAA